MIECYQACGELYNKRKGPSGGWQHKPGKTMVQSFWTLIAILAILLPQREKGDNEQQATRGVESQPVC